MEHTKEVSPRPMTELGPFSLWPLNHLSLASYLLGSYTCVSPFPDCSNHGIFFTRTKSRLSSVHSVSGSLQPAPSSPLQLHSTLLFNTVLSYWDAVAIALTLGRQTTQVSVLCLAGLQNEDAIILCFLTVFTVFVTSRRYCVNNEYPKWQVTCANYYNFIAGLYNGNILGIVPC